MFQWVNPKAWILAVGALSIFTSLDRSVYAQVLTQALIFAGVSIPSCSLWTALGVVISRLLGSPRALRLFNLAMGLLLAGSIVWIYLE
jgi:threonine/homoserine/homoserine lactone efflux protein